MSKSLKKQIEDIRTSINQGEISLAVKALEKLDIGNGGSFQNLASHLAFQYNICIKDDIKGIYSKDDRSKEINTIIARILEFLDQIESQNINKRFFGQKAIHNQEVILKLKEILFDPYSSIYNWHKEKASEDYERNFGFDIAISEWGREYFSFRENLKTPSSASIEQMAYVAQGLIKGHLGWSAKEINNANSSLNLYKNAYFILHCIQNATPENIPKFADFKKEAESIIVAKDDTLLKIKHKVQPYDEIGGLITFLTLNVYFDKSHAYTPFIFGLEESKVDSDIVLKIKEKNITITKMTFNYISLQYFGKVRLTIKLQNLKDLTCNLVIQKGQLFEVDKNSLSYQILSACKDTPVEIPPLSAINIDIELFPITPELRKIEEHSGLISCYKLIGEIKSETDFKAYITRFLEHNPFLKPKPDYSPNNKLLKIIGIIFLCILAMFILAMLLPFLFAYLQ